MDTMDRTFEQTNKPAKAGRIATRLSATFDSLTEGGIVGGTLTTGGITFSCLHHYGRYGNVMNPSLTIERVDAASGMGPTLSPRNYLTFCGFSQGPGGSFGRFGSMRISAKELGTSAGVEVFTSGPAENVLRLEALFDGRVVAVDSALLRDFPPTVTGSNITHRIFAVSGVIFDALRLIASGPKYDGAVMIGLDNVTITTNGEPNPRPSEA